LKPILVLHEITPKSHRFQHIFIWEGFGNKLQAYFPLSLVSSFATAAFSFFQKSPYIHAYNAKRSLNQKDRYAFYKFSWSVLVVPCLFSLSKFSWGIFIQEETNASLGTSFFPEHWIVVLYSHKLCHQFNFFCRETSLSSWRKRLLGVSVLADGCGRWGGSQCDVVCVAFLLTWKLCFILPAGSFYRAPHQLGTILRFRGLFDGLS